MSTTEGAPAALAVPPRRPVGAVVAVDIGGTTVKGLVRYGDEVVDRIVVPTFGTAPTTTDAPGGPALAAVHAVIDHLAASTASAGHPVAAIGVCTPGVVEPTSGKVVVAVNLDWTELPVADLLRSRYSVPVAVAHDARAAATAEIDARRTAGRDTEDMVFIPIGTGISASLVVGGQVVLGAMGGAGEVGHVCVRPGGEPCTCGQVGCVEAYASARNILRRYHAAGSTPVGGTEDVAAAVDHDPVAAAVWSDAVDALAAGVAIVAAILDPAVVVIGGGLGESGERLLAPLRTAVDARLGWRTTPRIEQSLAGAGAGLAGAAILAESIAAGSLDTTSPTNHDRSTP